MGKYGITKQMLIPAVFTVPSGVGEVILKQEQGWSYLRAGY
jgi:intracellular sulfur oxidation DsrE/DsrF family protein